MPGSLTTAGAARPSQGMGALVRCSVATDANGMSRGFGWVEFARARDALNAVCQLSNTLFMGRPVAIRPDAEATPVLKVRRGLAEQAS